MGEWGVGVGRKGGGGGGWEKILPLSAPSSIIPNVSILFQYLCACSFCYIKLCEKNKNGVGGGAGFGFQVHNFYKNCIIILLDY